MLSEDMRPKLKADTCYMQVPDGVYLRGNHGGLLLKGQSLYRLLVYLAPLLNGNTTLHTLTEDLKPDQKSMVIKMVDKLLVRHFLQDMSQQRPSSLRPAELATYASTVNFIASFQDNAAYHFEQFRNQRLLIIGSGMTFAALIQAGLQSGIRHIDGMSSQPGIEASFSPSDPEQTVRLLDGFPWDDQAATLDTIQAYDTIVAIADRPLLAQSRALNKLCVEQRRTFLQATIVSEHAWIGPLIRPDTLERGGCWECAWLRLQEHRGQQNPLYAFDDQLARTASQFLTPAVAMMLAYQLTASLLTACTQAGRGEHLAQMTTLDLPTFNSESHTIHPHPCCTACQQPDMRTEQQFLAQVQRLQQQEPLQPEAFVEQLRSCFDTELGLFVENDNSDCIQMPLNLQSIDIAAQGERVSVIGADLEIRKALLQAGLRACASYASRMMDPRRLLTNPLHQQPPLPVLMSATAANLNANDTTWTWSLDIQTRRPYLVPAARVFTNSTIQAGPGRGVAAGMSWDEAVCQALLDWSEYLTLTQLTQTQQAYNQIDLTSTPLDAEGRQLYQLLGATGQQISAYDVTGVLQIPTYALCLDSEVMAYGTHCTLVEALKNGMRRALLHYQLTRLDPSADVPMAVSDLPLNLRGDESYASEGTTQPETWSDRLEWLVQKFQAHRLRILAIPLDHDPVLSKLAPFIVRLLLTQTAQDRQEEWVAYEQ
ncbi:hypothetical protein KDA_39070 [Dictyobacter alpinus]|uniref:YcaO domain-containing protein n=1 Tax=Dictyobacter alpinus TaxID=2014873 RepID=A0A402BAK3_9CHLR|nr:TOMM precursor leader peptide-binding protein [Dictyobacter alpinus]GCE28423.1 hypothetical protein KDA_39070 [Dictyobacter alpinus]